MPGTYTVALMSGAKMLDSKPLKIVFDPDVHFGPGEHERYTAIVNDLHAIQRRGVAMATALNSLYPQMQAAAKSVGEKSDIPGNVAQFGLNKSSKRFEEVRGTNRRADVVVAAADAVAQWTRRTCSRVRRR
jgi:hypothetical protein